MNLRMIRALCWTGFLLAQALPLQAAPRGGRLFGVVADAAGTPQMGATVVVVAERLQPPARLELFTDGRGRFTADRLLPGSYSVQVTLAGFLPAVEPHIQVNSRKTTMLKIELGSVFSSLDRLRRPVSQKVDPDEWTWVLRSSSATRPVLRWSDGEIVLGGERTHAETSREHRPRGRVELTAGAHHPGSIANPADSPATAFAYGQNIGSAGRLLFAGQFSYQRASPAGGFSTTWLPSGDSKLGPVTTLAIRQSRLGPGGPTFRGMRLSHESHLEIGNRVGVEYGAEYTMAEFNGSSSALRPHADVTMELSPDWRISVILAARPWLDPSSASSSSLEKAVDSLDAFPTLLVRNGRPILENGWHEEVAVEHRIGRKASLAGAAFHDRATHTVIFGRGAVSNPDFLQDFFSGAFAYDGGRFSSWGARLAYHQRIAENLEATVVYAWAGALAPDSAVATSDLRRIFHTRYRQSLAGRVTSRVPHWGTELTASYKWISGPVVSRQDAYGESFYGLDPNLNLMFRQPLPSFFSTRMEALADFGNLLAQGYVPLTTRDGRLILVPAYRTFRGGVSFQF